MATKAEKERNLELFARRALEVLEPDLREVGFSEIENLLDFISRKLTEENFKSI